MSYRKIFTEAYNKVKTPVKEQEDKDHEISMARGELEAIADKATQLSAALQGKSDEGNPLEAWVQSKITKAKDYINSVSDYMMYKPEEVEEATYGWTLVSKAKDIAKKFKDNITKAVAEIEKLEKGLSKNPTVDAELRKYNEETELKENFSKSQIDRLKKEYEVLRGKKISVQNANKLSAMFKNIPDSGLTDLYKADIPFLSVMAMSKMVQKGIPRPAGVKLRMEELDQLEEMNDYGLKGTISDTQLANIKKTWANKTKKDITPGVRAMIAKMDTPTKVAIQHAKINVLSDLVKEDYTEKDVDKFHKKLDKLVHKSFGHSSDEKKMKSEEELEEGRMKDIFTAGQEGKSAEEIAKIMKLPLKTVKDILGEQTKVKQDTDIKDKEGTQPAKYYAKDADGDDMSKATKDKRAAHFKAKKDGPAPGDKDKDTKPSVHTKKFKQMYGEETLNEKIEGLENKAEKSGMPYSILKQVYDRGMAAYKTGHRPGTTAQQWAFARVNSFITKSSGTWGKADKDLADKVRGSKKEETIKEFKKMSVYFPKGMVDMMKASKLLIKKGFKVDQKGEYLKVDGKGADLNKYAHDLKNFYGATVKAEEKEEVDEACWTGYKQVGMKNKGGKQVPNCVPEGAKQLVDRILSEKLKGDE